MKSIILAMILMESGFNPAAYNKGGDASGLMQLTPIGIKEASIQCNLKKKPQLFDPMVNVLYGICLYNHYLKVSKSEIGALVLYHGGYVQYYKWKAGKPLGPKTATYVAKVLFNKRKFDEKVYTTDFACARYDLPPILCQR